jgi:hypothetical protein
MKQFKFDDEQIVIDKYLPQFPGRKMILSCLLINSDAIEVTIQGYSTMLFYACGR